MDPTAAAANQAAYVSLISLLVQSGTALALAWIAFKTATLAREQVTIKASQDAAVTKMEKLEKNTDGLKDALMKATGDARFGEGKDEERRQQEERVAIGAAAVAAAIPALPPVAGAAPATADLADIAAAVIPAAVVSSSAAATATVAANEMEAAKPKAKPPTP